MGMTIDRIIKKLLWFEDYNEDTYCGGDRMQDEYGDWYYKVNEEDFEAFRKAADTMRKYQKIAEIVTNNELEWGNASVRANAFLEVKKVIEDGNKENTRGGRRLLIEKHISVLQDIDKAYRTFTQEEYKALEYAIASLKTDLKYDLMYEGEEVYTKADMVTMLEKLKYELYGALCHEIHGKEDCPCTNQTTSCLATFRVCDADRAIGRVIQEKINALKENEDQCDQLTPID